MSASVRAWCRRVQRPEGTTSKGEGGAGGVGGLEPGECAAVEREVAAALAAHPRWAWSALVDRAALLALAAELNRRFERYGCDFNFPPPPSRARSVCVSVCSLSISLSLLSLSLLYSILYLSHALSDRWARAGRKRSSRSSTTPRCSEPPRGADPRFQRALSRRQTVSCTLCPVFFVLCSHEAAPLCSTHTSQGGAAAPQGHAAALPRGGAACEGTPYGRGGKPRRALNSCTPGAPRRYGRGARMGNRRGGNAGEARGRAS
jgi:hypothetical protein